ncbi:Ccc1p [Sugiyamaella lignohabitans]|uniref:Ccc1p n=1 Tax=Sugiyamaella lignohabitans TaxID=796027 RepID=A0A167C0Y5_9ASCO|nr:Ccc1p [Sugiyamaella lignohabitans]ANB11082.1 Ccc1p [Sugiyamaella lignohabitans]
MLVLLKNAIFGSNQDDRRSLLPTARSYDSVNTIGCDNCQDDDTCSRSSSATASSFMESGIANPRVMSDIIIGLSDGLTVPFALTAGLSSLGDSKLVITGGLAELVSGAISMGLGGYLAARSESEYYEHQVAKEKATYAESPCLATQSIQEVLAEYKLSPETIKSFVADLEKSQEDTVNFIIRFARGLEEPASGREFTSAMTIGLAYFMGGFVPLIPYFFANDVVTGLYISAIVMAITLFLFGSIKTVISLGKECGRSQILSNGVKMTLTGGVAAAAAWGLVRAIDN